MFVVAPGRSAGKLLTADPKTCRLIVGELAAHIERQIIELEIGLLMLDPFVKAHGNDENSNIEMDAVAQVLSDLAVKFNIAVDLPHHISKGVADPGNAGRSRGASATTNAARLVYTLSAMSAEEAQRFDIPEDDRRGYIRLDRAKLNVAKTGGPCQWFKFVSVRLDNADALYPSGDEVQTVEVWKPPSAWAGLDFLLINRILTALDEGLPDGNFYTDAAKATGR